MLPKYNKLNFIFSPFVSLSTNQSTPLSVETEGKGVSDCKKRERDQNSCTSLSYQCPPPPPPSLISYSSVLRSSLIRLIKSPFSRQPLHASLKRSLRIFLSVLTRCLFRSMALRSISSSYSSWHICESAFFSLRQTASDGKKRLRGPLTARKRPVAASTVPPM